MNKPQAALAVVEPAEHEISYTQPMTLDGVLRQVKLIQDIMRNVMQEGTHYGASFPGDNKKSLLKPGAEKLLFVFRLSPSQEVDVIDLPNFHREYRIKTIVREIGSGRIVAEGVGSASTMESKYRYRNAAMKCPACGKESIIKGKADYGGGWLCFAKKGGCGAKFDDGDQQIEGQPRGKIENPDIADVWNTCLKISSKRSLVNATILATACGDLFSQDADDLEEKIAENAPPHPPAPAPAPKETESAQHRAQKPPPETDGPSPIPAKPVPTTPAAPTKPAPVRFEEACESICQIMGNESGMKFVGQIQKKHSASGPNASIAAKMAALDELEKLVNTGEVEKIQQVGF